MAYSPPPFRPNARRLFGYLWAAPNTVLGLAAGAVMWSLGGRVRCVAGVVEFEGGLVGRRVARLAPRFRFGAWTLGHVILGSSRAELDTLRRHEHVHVRQYERWGVLFLPAYALSSLWQAAHGRCGYRCNRFEREAYAECASPTLSNE